MSTHRVLFSHPSEYSKLNQVLVLFLGKKEALVCFFFFFCIDFLLKSVITFLVSCRNKKWILIFFTSKIYNIYYFYYLEYISLLKSTDFLMIIGSNDNWLLYIWMLTFQCRISFFLKLLFALVFPLTLFLYYILKFFQTLNHVILFI